MAPREIDICIFYVPLKTAPRIFFIFTLNISLPFPHYFDTREQITMMMKEICFVWQK